VENVEFAGAYIADNKGYYKAEGFLRVHHPAGPLGHADGDRTW